MTSILCIYFYGTFEPIASDPALLSGSVNPDRCLAAVIAGMLSIPGAATVSYPGTATIRTSSVAHPGAVTFGAATPGHTACHS
jgi:hypothetical protein